MAIIDFKATKCKHCYKCVRNCEVKAIMIKDERAEIMPDKCILCGKTYTYCSRCEEFDHLPRWMEIYCSDNCRTIFNTLTEYNAENITAREAAERMKDCDMSDVSKFHEVNQKMIAKIQKETADIKLQKISEKDIVEPDSVVDEENSEEIETRKPVRTRKRK